MQPETVHAPAQSSPLPNAGNGESSPSPNGRNGENEPFPSVSNGDRSPSVAATDVRDSRGRFAKGNPGGPGNPHGRRIERLRAILIDSISDDDFRLIVARLAQRAKAFGELPWIREVLNRTIGKARSSEGMDDDEA